MLAHPHLGQRPLRVDRGHAQQGVRQVILRLGQNLQKEKRRVKVAEGKAGAKVNDNGYELRKPIESYNNYIIYGLYAVAKKIKILRWLGML